MFHAHAYVSGEGADVMQRGRYKSISSFFGYCPKRIWLVRVKRLTQIPYRLDHPIDWL